MIYRVKNWDTNFEGAKSKTYNNKTSCQMPTKHGLGYKKIIRSENGTSVFGAWCALIQVLSRHKNPRQGYCTDTGRIPQEGGVPYTPDDLEMLTDIPSEYFKAMFDICTSQSVGWVEVIDTGIPQGYHRDTTGSPDLDSDLDPDLNSDSDVDSKSSGLHADMINEFLNCVPEFAKLNPEAIATEIHKAGGNPRLKQNHDEFIADMMNSIKLPPYPVKTYGRYLQSDGLQRKKQTGRRSTI